MMEGWKEYKLGDVAPYFTEKINSEEINSQNYISADNMLPDRNGIVISDYTPTSGKVTKYETNDILISNIRPYFKKIYFAKERGGCSNDVIVFRANNELANATFLYYVLSKDDFFDFMMAGANGTKMPRGNKKAIPKYKINLPPLPTQRKIAKILSAYDDLIENNLKRIKLLEEMAQKTYEEWFVRMKFPGHETAVFDEESGLPEGWKKVKLGEACSVSGGGTPSKVVDEYWQNGTITWFSPTDLSKANSYCLLDSSNKITELGLKKSSAKLMQPNSFMMTSRATIGLFGLIDKPFATNQGFINVTPQHPEHKYYLFFNFKFRVPEFLNHATGSTFPELSKSKFKFLKIKWPTQNILKEFDKKINPIIENIMNLEIQNQRLKEARDILLPRLMTGMIDVENIKI